MNEKMDITPNKQSVRQALKELQHNEMANNSRTPKRNKSSEREIADVEIKPEIDEIIVSGFNENNLLLPKDISNSFTNVLNNNLDTNSLKDNSNILPDIVNFQPNKDLITQSKAEDSFISSLAADLGNLQLSTPPGKADSTLLTPTNNISHTPVSGGYSGFSSDDETFAECQTFLDSNDTLNTSIQWNNVLSSVTSQTAESIDNVLEQVETNLEDLDLPLETLDTFDQAEVDSLSNLNSTIVTNIDQPLPNLDQHNLNQILCDTTLIDDIISSNLNENDIRELQEIINGTSSNIDSGIINENSVDSTDINLIEKLDVKEKVFLSVGARPDSDVNLNDTINVKSVKSVELVSECKTDILNETINLPQEEKEAEHKQEKDDFKEEIKIVDSSKLTENISEKFEPDPCLNRTIDIKESDTESIQVQQQLDVNLNLNVNLNGQDQLTNNIALNKIIDNLKPDTDSGFVSFNRGGELNESFVPIPENTLTPAIASIISEQSQSETVKSNKINNSFTELTGDIKSNFEELDIELSDNLNKTFAPNSIDSQLNQTFASKSEDISNSGHLHETFVPSLQAVELAVANGSVQLNETFAAGNQFLSSTVNYPFNSTFDTTVNLNGNSNHTTIPEETTLNKSDEIMVHKTITNDQTEEDSNLDLTSKTGKSFHNDDTFAINNNEEAKSNNPVMHFNHTTQNIDLENRNINSGRGSKPKDKFVDTFVADHDVMFKTPFPPSCFGNKRRSQERQEFTDDDFQSTGIILNPSDFDFLLSKGNNNIEIDRSSLLLRFDPLLGHSVAVNHHSAQEQQQQILQQQQQQQPQQCQKNTTDSTNNISSKSSINQKRLITPTPESLDIIYEAKTSPVGDSHQQLPLPDRSENVDAQEGSLNITNRVGKNLNLVHNEPTEAAATADTLLETNKQTPSIEPAQKVKENTNKNQNSRIQKLSNISSKDIRSQKQDIKNDVKMSVDVIRDIKTENDVKSFDNISEQCDEKKDYKMAELEKKIKNESLKTEDIEKKLKDAEQREEVLLKRITEKDKTIAKMCGVMEAYEKTIAELIAEKEQIQLNYEKQLTEIKSDRDLNYQHLTSLEATFSDLHAKYERSKQIATALKSNEEALFADKKEILEHLRLQEIRYEKMKNHAMQQLEIANNKLESLTKNHSSEITKLKALLKKEEISRLSTNEQLQQKSRENEELMKICDELINGQGS